MRPAGGKDDNLIRRKKPSHDLLQMGGEETVAVIKGDHCGVSAFAWGIPLLGA